MTEIAGRSGKEKVMKKLDLVWLEVHIPANDDDSNPYSLNGTSGRVGFRIFRD